MSTIHFNRPRPLTPEQYVAGLTDFGAGRSKLFGNSADADLKVHSESAHHADVTEGLRRDLGAPGLRRVRSPPGRREDHRFERVGLVTPGTPTPSPSGPTGRPPSTTSWSVRARTSRDGSSASSSGPSARASCVRRSSTASRRSKARDRGSVTDLPVQAEA